MLCARLCLAAMVIAVLHVSARGKVNVAARS